MTPMSSGGCTSNTALRGSYCRMFCRIYCRILCRILFPHIARSHTFSKDEWDRHGDPPANFKKISEQQHQASKHTFQEDLSTTSPADLIPSRLLSRLYSPAPVSFGLGLFCVPLPLSCQMRTCVLSAQHLHPCSTNHYGGVGAMHGLRRAIANGV